jgi:hypothetical protein
MVAAYIKTELDVCPSRNNHTTVIGTSKNSKL